MEACAGAHHWATPANAAKGFTRSKIIPPQFVKPFIKSNKNDAKDAEAICEAMSGPTMHFVKVKDSGPTRSFRRHIVFADEMMSHRIGEGQSDTWFGGGVWPGGTVACFFASSYPPTG